METDTRSSLGQSASETEEDTVSTSKKEVCDEACLGGACQFPPGRLGWLPILSIVGAFTSKYRSSGAGMGRRFSDFGSFPVLIEKPEASEPKEEEKATAGAGSLVRELRGPRERLSSVPRL